ncbi:hypothetical protein FX474_12930 [Salmonella enterica]|nr:hypothetical protein [Salmonella enterica]
MFKVRLNYIIPDGEVVRVSLSIDKEDGVSMFRTELPINREEGKELSWYEETATATYTSLICDIAANIGKKTGGKAQA